MYVKHDQAESGRKQILRELKLEDGNKRPFVKLLLADWEFLQKDLINLLVYHKKDKHLSFFTVKLMFKLTQMPQRAEMSQPEYEDSWIYHKSKYRHRMFEILRTYKVEFLKKNVVSTLVEHLAECLQAEDRHQKHDEMIELIIMLFKQLLQIPDARVGLTDTKFANRKIQKELLHVFHEENVLDSFNYLSQEFKTPIQQKLCMQILEIQYQIIKGFTPEQVFMSNEKEREAKMAAFEVENENERRRKFLRSARHSKFGTQL